MKHFILSLMILSVCLPPTLRAASAAGVVVAEDDNSFTLSNAVVSARVAKRSGDLVSLKYRGLEMLDGSSARPSGYWSHDVARGERTTRITIDPATNDGRRGEVSVKGVANGNAMGNGPGGSVIADIEIRFTLGRDDSGIYTYCIFSHPTNYPGTTIGEARFCAKLSDDVFDWMTVDANRNMQMITTYDWNHATPMNMKEARRMNSGKYLGQVEHKYDYSANQFDVRAWGWSSTTKHVGLWYVNASVEYLSGGPTKVELSAHRDATFNTNALNAPAPPTLLNYWRGSHYGGSICAIAQTDAWTKVIGPFLIYCNSGPTPNAMWKDALAKSTKESDAWPYDWVEGVDYPHSDQRGTVKGRLDLADPQAPNLKPVNLLVGLAAPDYTPPRTGGGGGGGGGRGGRGGFGGGALSLAGGGDDEAAMTNQFTGDNVFRNASLTNQNSSTSGTNENTGARGGGRRGGRGGFGGGGGFGFGPRIVEWQNDAKFYQFWVRGDSRGNFSIPNVRPGTYTLHAISDGVLGEAVLTNVVVEAGKTLTLGALNWKPLRYGKQLWEIGVPNRKGSEFFKGDDYFHWGWYLEYPKLFPNDVNYVVGKSDWRKDWFFEQLPHNEDTNNTTGRGSGRSTTWSIMFNLPKEPQGKAILRVALAGIGTRSLTVTVNDQPAGTLTGLQYNATINRDGIGGSWLERTVSFDASLMKAGDNVMKLTIPGGGLTSGILYDYLRLELDETAAPPKQTANAAAVP